MTENYAVLVAVLQKYFDGLYHSDVHLLGEVFHPAAMYASATDGRLLHLGMDEYFPIVAKRPAPANTNAARADRILSIEFAGPVTALARVECSVAPKHFTDLLTLVLIDGRWQIIAKVFHYELDRA